MSPLLVLVVLSLLNNANAARRPRTTSSSSDWSNTAHYGPRAILISNVTEHFLEKVFQEYGDNHTGKITSNNFLQLMDALHLGNVHKETTEHDHDSHEHKENAHQSATRKADRSKRSTTPVRIMGRNRDMKIRGKRAANLHVGEEGIHNHSGEGTQNEEASISIYHLMHCVIYIGEPSNCWDNLYNLFERSDILVYSFFNHTCL